MASKTAAPAPDAPDELEAAIPAERVLIETVQRGNGTEAQYWRETDGTITRTVATVTKDDEAADQ